MNIIMKFSDEYMYFLNNGKTERECASFVKKMLIENGFKDISETETLSPGDKVFYINSFIDIDGCYQVNINFGHDNDLYIFCEDKQELDYIMKKFTL